MSWFSIMSLNSEWIQLLIDFSLQRENKLQLQVHRQGSVNNIKVEKWAHSVQCKCQFCSLSHKVQSMGNSKYAIPMSTTQSHVKSNLIQRIPSWFVWVCLHVCLFECHTIVLVIIEGKLLVLCLSLFHCFVPKTPRGTQRKPAFLEPHNCNLL